MILPRPFAKLVEDQYGVFARWQARRDLAGQPVDSFMRGPSCETMEHGIRRIVGGARLPEQAAFAAVLRCGPGAVLSGPAAMRLLDVDGIRGDDPFVVLLPTGRRVRGVDFPIARDADPGRAVSTRGDVRIAGPVDALLDSARFVDELSPRKLRLAHDVLRWRGLITPGKLSARARMLGRQLPAGDGLDLLLELDGTEAAGDGERELGRLLEAFEPPPEAQVWVTPRRRVDWYFRSVRYGYEYQGGVDHGTVAGRRADDARDAELRREGVRLGYVTAADLADERALLATVAGTLSIRAHELGVDPPVLRSKAAPEPRAHAPVGTASRSDDQAGRSSR